MEDVVTATTVTTSTSTATSATLTTTAATTTTTINHHPTQHSLAGTAINAAPHVHVVPQPPPPSKKTLSVDRAAFLLLRVKKAFKRKRQHRKDKQIAHSAHRGYVSTTGFDF
ncbi:hypothetical protein DOY81_004375 [Sarcophaga bullata]|nr:hypothetical protein DOY81_004375 [Sarcophaga bullata]